jgi:hypothetical protein
MFLKFLNIVDVLLLLKAKNNGTTCAMPVDYKCLFRKLHPNINYMFGTRPCQEVAGEIYIS